MQPETYDVIIAGGGSAGVAAAFASAETGARTLLVEKFNCLGGASTMRGVSTYCGLYTLGDKPRQVVGGVADRVLAGLRQRGAVSDVQRHRGVFVVFDPESVKCVLDDLCVQAGVTVMLGAMVVAANRQDGQITGVTIADHSGLNDVAATAFVDCTGDGDLLAQSGADTRYGNDGQVNLGTLAARFGGIPQGVSVSAQNLADAVARYDKDRVHTTKDKSVLVRLPISHDLICYVASADYDPRDTHSMSAAERDGRRQVWHYLAALKTIAGCENAYLVSTGPEFGTRESRHIQAKRMFTWRDVVEGTQFDDCIAYGAWGAEWHDRQDFSSSFEMPPNRDAYQIPMSCLISRNTNRLFAAGRLADGDRLGGAAIRVMGTAFATGQACGVAAALSVENTVPSIAGIRKTLRLQNAIL
ncbi:MAG: FAD-dependent oxidoreductase [Rhodobacteraceae bacterium]|nr:FAD-dependent oxidoreductase [Paracoccaceae bacterium]